MWCAICFAHRDNPVVYGNGAAPNPLRLPTQSYRIEKVKNHESRGFHLHAMALQTMQSTCTVEGLAIAIPPAQQAQVKTLFRTIYMMLKNRLADTVLRPMLTVQQQNGVQYGLRYKNSLYCRVVKRYLAKAVRNVFAPTFLKARFRSLMLDEVKVGDREWMSVAVRLCSVCCVSHRHEPGSYWMRGSQPATAQSMRVLYLIGDCGPARYSLTRTK